MTLPNVPKDGTMPEAVRSWLERVKRYIEDAYTSIGEIVIPTKASSAETIAGTNDEKFLTPLRGVDTVKTFSPFLKFAYFEDQKSAGTAGGVGSSYTSAYVARTLNTEVYNGITGVSLSSNQVTLPAGTYLIEGSCPGHRVNSHKCRLYNDTTTSVIAYGTSEYAAVGSGSIVVTRSHVTTRVTFSETTTIELQHRLGSGTNSEDLGKAASLTGAEVYSFLKIWKLD